LAAVSCDGEQRRQLQAMKNSGEKQFSDNFLKNKKEILKL
jgi:hypothetical protein